ncbi:MAG: site-2 protease family protein [Methanobacteriaceae archaeon]
MELFISFLVISLAFAILFTRGNIDMIIFVIPIVMVGVGLGFILHEVAHKIAAMNYGYWAEYKLWVPGLFIALISSYFGFIFAAPGAVHIYGQYMDDRQNGIISLAGPAINILLALIFLVLVVISPTLGIDYSTFLYQIFALGFSINSFLALFNLIPFSVLDGAKIFRWNPIIWLTAALVAGAMTFYSMAGGLFL